MLEAVANWVEKGIASDGTAAGNTAVATGSDARTRPLCPYPQIVTSKGTGDTQPAANLACRNP